MIRRQPKDIKVRRQVFCIFERLGLGGGGKIKAVYHRLNMLAASRDYEPILLNMTHDPMQQGVFCALVEQGKIDSRVSYSSIFDALDLADVELPVLPAPSENYISRVRIRSNGREYLGDRGCVMRDYYRSTSSVGGWSRQIFHADGTDETYHYAGPDLVSSRRVEKSGAVHNVMFTRGRAVARTAVVGREFKWGLNILTGKKYFNRNRFISSFFPMIGGDNAITFLDGVTSAYVSPSVRGARVLFLHADHRAPSGKVSPRSKSLIEKFDGDTIVTSTNVHKRALEADLAVTRPINVIPHFVNEGGETLERRNIVTVSRLELNGKPIGDAIRAFSHIADEYPDCNYLIYGDGSGEGELRKLISEMKLGGRVRLMGYTNQPDSAFSEALFSVYPTMTEGFGLSILESLAQGCPVLTYDVDYGPREMIRPGVNGELVSPRDIGALAAAMRSMLKHSSSYLARAREGLSQYSRASYEKNYRKLLASLAIPT